MITRLELTGDQLTLTDDMKRYVEQKIGKLDRYLSRHARKTAHAEVILKEEPKKSNNKFTAEVILHLPQQILTAKDSTLNIFAAIDIVEAKMRTQLTKYKAKANAHQVDRKGVMARLKRLADRDFWGAQN